VKVSFSFDGKFLGGWYPKGAKFMVLERSLGPTSPGANTMRIYCFMKLE
jgi:hypothetical protein